MTNQGTPQRSHNRLRLAVIDRDPGFMQVLSNRLDGLGWEYHGVSSAVTADALVAMRLNALVIDVGVIGPGSWEYLERVCSRLPGLAVIVCTGPSSVAQRVRGLRLGLDAWVTKPCHAEELICVIEAAIRRHRRNEMPELDASMHRRRDHDPSGPLPGVRERGQPRADGAGVRDPAAARAVRSRAAARGDLRARVGLRDGPRRPVGRRVRAQAPPEAPCSVRRSGATSTPTSGSATGSPPSATGRALDAQRARRAAARGRRRPRADAGRVVAARASARRRSSLPVTSSLHLHHESVTRRWPVRMSSIQVDVGHCSCAP